MGVLVVGSVALDAIEVPWSKKTHEVLGGSATYAALAARYWTPSAIVAVVGSDFPKKYRTLLDKKKINTRSLAQAQGRTFYWKGRYNKDFQPVTRRLDLGVFSSFKPVLSAAHQNSRTAFLGNIHPSLQWEVFRQLKNPWLTACDSRDDWIKGDKKNFLSLVKKMDLLFLNDTEARLLTGENNLVRATQILSRMGPQVAIVKKGEHGVLMASRDAFYSLPAVPMHRVWDPTGAGDSFAGACLGFLDRQKKVTWNKLCRSLEYGSVVASMTIEAYGPDKLVRSDMREVSRRVRRFRSLAGAVIV